MAWRRHAPVYHLNVRGIVVSLGRDLRRGRERLLLLLFLVRLQSRGRGSHVVQLKGKEPSSLPSPAVFHRLADPDALVWARPHSGGQVRAPAPRRANFMDWPELNYSWNLSQGKRYPSNAAWPSWDKGSLQAGTVKGLFAAKLLQTQPVSSYSPKLAEAKGLPRWPKNRGLR